MAVIESKNGWTRVEHEKITLISTSRHVIFCLLYKHINNNVFDDFPKISDHFPKISEDFPKLFQRLDECLRTFFKHFPKIAEDCRGLPKVAEDFREGTNVFRSYNTTSEYFSSDYVAIAMAISILVTTTWYFYRSKYHIFTCENIWIFSVAEILIKHWCLFNKRVYLIVISLRTLCHRHLKWDPCWGVSTILEITTKWWHFLYNRPDCIDMRGWLYTDWTVS